MIKTRARFAAGTRSYAAAKQRQRLDRKIRSIDSYLQSTMTQLQERWSLPFTNRHHRSLLPQFNSLRVAEVQSCRVRRVGGILQFLRAAQWCVGTKMGCRHIAPELVFEASNGLGDSGACWNAAKQQCKSAVCRALVQSLGHVERQRETVV